MTTVRDLPFAELTRRFLLHQRGRDLSPNTIDHYQDSFADFARFCREVSYAPTASSLTTELFHHFHRWLKETPTRAARQGTTQRAPLGVIGDLRDLRALVRWLQREGLLDPTVKVVVPAVPQTFFEIFSDEDLHLLMSCKYLVGESEQAVRNRAIVGLLLDSGMRLGELCGITLDKLDLDDRSVLVLGKGRKLRYCYFSGPVAQLLKVWLRVRGDHPGTLFELSPPGVQCLFKRMSAHTGLHVHPHKFRHTSATKMVRANMDLHSVKRILGHAQLATTEVYLSLSHEDLKAKHAVASPFEQLAGTGPRVNSRTKKVVRRRLRLNESGKRKAV